MPLVFTRNSLPDKAILDNKITPYYNEYMTDIDLDNPEFYLNRELSLLEFNWRILQQALNSNVPLLERLNYLCISSSNLDEFFEVRVADLIRQLEMDNFHPNADQASADEVLKRISHRAHELVDEQYRVLNNVLLPELTEQSIEILRRQAWSDSQKKWLHSYFNEQVAPIVIPVGLDSAHPFPRLLNKSLNFFISLTGKDAFGHKLNSAILQVPRSLMRIIKLPTKCKKRSDHEFVFLSSIIHGFADDLFYDAKIKGCYQFRVTRNSDLAIDTEENDNLLVAVSDGLSQRNYGDEVRLEIAHNCPDILVEFLRTQCGIAKDNVYLVNGPVNLDRLEAIYSLVERPDLKFRPFKQGQPSGLSANDDIFATVRKKDMLLHHPYQSLLPVVNFIKQAANDASVLAIKQTLYRTGAQSPIVDALVKAAQAGKEVTVVIELRARFDEETNIALATRLHQAAVHVVYGIVGYKTHAKMLLVLRREHTKISFYCHLGTGNYHLNTSHTYTDYGMLTANKHTGEDVNNLFTQLTSLGKIPKMHKLLHAPFTLHKGLLKRIDKEIAHARDGKAAHIIIKVNALVEPKIIKACYRASMAGVQIDLIVRSICCLKPGVTGLSDNIRVRSIVGRFLEHERLFYFNNDGDPNVLAGSADMMTRNLFKRVETCFPITHKKLRQQIIDDLMLYLSDNAGAWTLADNGRYSQVNRSDNDKTVSAQTTLLQSLATTSTFIS